MKPALSYWGGLFIALAAFIDVAQSLCVLESDFGFKINCAFKKSGLFRVRNLGGIKAHASLGFSLGDELGFEQSLTNLDPSRRRSVSVKNGAPNIIVDTSNRPAAKQEKRGKQNRIMMRPMSSAARPNQAAMEKLSSLHRRVSSTMQPIVVQAQTVATRNTITNAKPTITLAKPMPMGVPPFRPLPPKEDTLKVLPIASTKKTHSPLEVPQSMGPGLAYTNPVPHQVHDLASLYPGYNTKKVDDYNSITGYGDDTTLKFNKEDINAKIAEIAKSGNISMEAVEAAIVLRQQQLLNKYANLPIPTTSTSTSTTTTTEEPLLFQVQPEPEIVVASVHQKPKRNPTSGKVMNAPREYYPVGYEKNFDDHFQSKVDLPETSFHCGDQKYFPGLYGDESLGCMVFHVCALTDDGLVMKSFLCPESTLFDQTILKCNWWFYVDCKNTARLYDTNIPVSKSYQLMKALTFFSSYKKEMQDGNSMNPEDIDGIKEAITILENQDTKADKSSIVDGLQIVTPQPIIIDERNNHRTQYSNTTSPVYRGNREYNNSTDTRNARHNTERKETIEDEFKLVTVNADLNFTNTNSTSARNSSNSSLESSERKHRRRMTLRFSPTTQQATFPTTTLKSESELTTFSSSLVEIMKQEMQPMENITTEVKQEKLTDQLDKIDETNLKQSENSPPVKRFYRSSAEINKDEKVIEVINNEKVQIVRPTSSAKLVGDYPTPTAAIAKLDEAILGRSNLRRRKHVTFVHPLKTEEFLSPNRQGT
ncbi:unnamed protein product [Parnassius mnemosyne]|uniref:Chitin-binding type-2 domain-containing protein n=1 Tax=Parnassius mnemosyne TaxID=213953 RepID=A0AAV1LDV3_9NEOP